MKMGNYINKDFPKQRVVQFRTYPFFQSINTEKITQLRKEVSEKFVIRGSNF